MYYKVTSEISALYLSYEEIRTVQLLTHTNIFDDRETKSLVEAAKTLKEAKEFVIITYEEEKELNMDGVKIQVIPVWKWLLKMDLQNSLEMC